MLQVLFLHGALGSASIFDSWASTFKPFVDFHSLDFSGHGKKSPVDKLSFDLFKNDILEYLNANNIDQIHVFGYSMGAYTALLAAIDHGDRFGKIISLGTKFHWTEEIATKEALRLNPQIINNKVPHFATQLKTIHGDKWELVVRQTADLMMSLGHQPLISEQECNKISHACLICRGELDSMVSMEESLTIAQQLIHGKFLSIPKKSHTLDQYEPQEILKIILDFNH